MDYVAHKCPNCGGKLSSSSNNGIFVCEYCGQTVTAEGKISNPAVNLDPSKATVTMAYDADHYLVIPDMHVTVKGREFSIKNHSQLKLVLDKGEHDFLFKSSIRKNKFHLDLEKDTFLQIGWNRVTGKLVVEIASDQESAHYL